MIRLARKEDAEQLLQLCNQFNGEGETSQEHIEQSILQTGRRLSWWRKRMVFWRGSSVCR